VQTGWGGGGWSARANSGWCVQQKIKEAGLVSGGGKHWEGMEEGSGSRHERAGLWTAMGVWIVTRFVAFQSEKGSTEQGGTCSQGEVLGP